ncbi:Protein of unknown function [Gryllus bimaculatus]|nr:Protein of unknown function [Gryllus bimaculatus]
MYDVSSKWRKQKGRMTKKKAIAREKTELRLCSKNVTDDNVARERATSSQYELSKPSTENTFDSSKIFIESNADISRNVQKLSFLDTNVSDISDRTKYIFISAYECLG